MASQDKKQDEEDVKQIEPKQKLAVKKISIMNYFIASGWLPADGGLKYMSKINQKHNKLSLLKQDNEKDWNELILATWDPLVINFYNYIQSDPRNRQLCNQMIAQQKETIKIYDPQLPVPIENIEAMCASLNSIIVTTPLFTSVTDDLIGVPMAALFSVVAENGPGVALFMSNEFNQKLKAIINKWMQYLDQQISFTNDNNGGWLSETAIQAWGPLDLFVTDQEDSPYFNSWNSWFSRELKQRNVDSVNDNSIIVSSNSGVYNRYRNNILPIDIFWLKDQPYSLMDIFGTNHGQYVKDFTGGIIFQSYLTPLDYHRYWTPVSGKIVDMYLLEGAYFAQLLSVSYMIDPGAGNASLPWLLEVNVRGILIIDTTNYANIGKVAIIPIGMGEVSSVNFWNKQEGVELKIGDVVQKGDEVGSFKYGGSSIAIVFQNLSLFDKQITFEDDQGNVFPKDPLANNPIIITPGKQIAVISSL